MMTDFFAFASDPERQTDRLVSLLSDEVIEAGLAHRSMVGYVVLEFRDEYRPSFLHNLRMRAYMVV